MRDGDLAEVASASFEVVLTDVETMASLDMWLELELVVGCEQARRGY